MVLRLDDFTGKPASDVYKTLDSALFDRMRLKEIVGVNPVLDLALYHLAQSSEESMNNFSQVANVDELKNCLTETFMNRANYFKFFQDLDDE